MANGKRIMLYETTVIVLKARGKRTLTDVICHYKIMTVMALDGVALF